MYACMYACVYVYLSVCLFTMCIGRCVSATVSRTRTRIQRSHEPQRLRLRCRRRRWPLLHASSAPLPRNLGKVAVALVVVLGSGTADMPAKHTSVIHGPRAFGLAKVGCEEAQLCDVYCVNMMYVLPPVIHGIQGLYSRERLRPRGW